MILHVRFIRNIFAGVHARIGDSSITYSVLRRGIIGTILIMCALSISIYFYEHYNEKKYLIEKSAAVRYRVSNTFSLPFWNLDQPMIDTLVELELRDEDLLGFAFYDRNGIFAHGHYKRGGNIFLYRDDGNTAVIFKDKIRKERAFFNVNNSDVGYADIYFTDDAITRRMWGDIIRGVFLFVIVGGSIFIFLHRSIQSKVIAPVVDLSRVVREFSRKNFSVRSPVHAGDEIGELALHF
ncbi:MAG TPA: HAMP domain-containing protein, partial [Spirochaetota bacterium]